jgi:hypothetical protein
LEEGIVFIVINNTEHKAISKQHKKGLVADIPPQALGF